MGSISICNRCWLPMPGARHIARRYRHRGEPVEDLEQIGYVGLIKALDRFDPEQGHSFLAYAVPTVTGEIRRHFRDKTWMLQVPRRLKDLQVSISKVVDELSQDLGRAPRPSDIAGRLGISLDEVLQALEAGQADRVGSLDTPLRQDAGQRSRRAGRRARAVHPVPLPRAAPGRVTAGETRHPDHAVLR